MCFYGSRLRYLLINYAILPHVANDDQDIVQPNDAYTLPLRLVEHLVDLQKKGGFSLEGDVDWCTVPTVDMTVVDRTSESNDRQNKTKEDDNSAYGKTRKDKSKTMHLPLTFLPLNVAITCPSPPAFGMNYSERKISSPIPQTSGIDDDQSTPHLHTPFEASMTGGGTDKFFDRTVYERSPIPIFVSHRWRDHGDPNADNEFVKLKNMLTNVVACAVQACIALLHDGFPLDLIVKYRPFLRPAFRIHNGLPLDFDELQRTDFSKTPETFFDSLQEISGHLARDIFALTAKTVLLEWQTYERNRPYEDIRRAIQKKMMISVMKRIWLWYDYSSLPQHEIRKDDDALQNRFNRTLAYLPQLQNCMHTVCMNSSENYFNRAWCMSEYLNAKTTQLHGRSQFKSPLRLGKNEKEVIAYKWFELLINPTESFSNLLINQLELRFTNSTHEDIYSRTICWIAWNSILRREHFQYEYYAAPKSVADEVYLRFLVGRGTPKNVSLWLDCVCEALKKPMNQDSGPFWIAMGRSTDELSYSLETWEKRRAAAGEAERKNPYEIIVPFCYDEKVETSYLVRALSVAKEKLDELSDKNEQVEVYLRNVCERTLHSENQDFLGDFEVW